MIIFKLGNPYQRIVRKQFGEEQIIIANCRAFTSIDFWERAILHMQISYNISRCITSTFYYLEGLVRAI